MDCSVLRAIVQRTRAGLVRVSAAFRGRRRSLCDIRWAHRPAQLADGNGSLYAILYSFRADDVAHTATNRSDREKTENFVHENTPTVSIATSVAHKGEH
jgi:hypothetical protein